MTVVVINKKVLEAIGQSPALTAQLEEKAERVAAEARRTAPDAPPIGKGYIASIRVVTGIDDGRAVARVISGDRKAIWVEYGAHAAGITPVLGLRVLGRALEVIGEQA